MKKPILLCCFIGISLSLFAQSWSDTARAIDDLLAKYKPDMPGCELAISRNGTVIYSKALGMADLEHQVPLSTTSVTEAGSVSKQFTAAAILLLEQAGKLSLDDDVRKYIPELPDYGTPILLKYMMHHSSGLRDWGSVAAIAGWPRTTKTYNNYDALDILAHQQALNNIPNDSFAYSNSGYNLFAIIVERVSGMSLAEYTHRYIFEPAGMTHTSWRDDHKRIVPGRAIAYSLEKGIYRTNMPNEDVYGNGGLLTTAEDLLKWNEYYLSGKLGNPSLLARQLTTEKLNNGKDNEYAAGLFTGTYHHERLVVHDGATAGYRSKLMAFPDKQLSIAWLSNTSAFDGTKNVANQIANLFFPQDDIIEAPKKEPNNDKERDLTFAILNTHMPDYTGTFYSQEAQAGFTVVIKEGNLYLTRTSPRTSIPLIPKGRSQFVTGGDGFDGETGRIEFLRGGDKDKKAITGLTVSINRAAKVYFAKMPATLK